MIQLLKEGRYRLLETKHHAKLLLLDDEAYVWISSRGTGEIQMFSHTPHKTDTILALGHYRLYHIQGEPSLSDQPHLELSVGEGVWQSYILPTGLPSADKTRSQVMPTNETITSPSSL